MSVINRKNILVRTIGEERSLSLHSHHAISPDEKIMAVSKAFPNNSAFVHFYNVQTGERYCPAIHFPNAINDLSWSADGTRLYVSSFGYLEYLEKEQDAFVRAKKALYTSKDWLYIRVLGLKNGHVVFATNGGLVRVLNENHKRIFQKYGNFGFEDIHALPSGDSVLLASSEPIYRIGPSTKPNRAYEIETIPPLRYITKQVAQTPNGTLLGLSAFFIEYRKPGQNESGYVRSHREIYSMLVIDDETIAISVQGSEQGKTHIRILHFPSGKELCHINGPKQPFRKMTLFGNGQYLAASVSEIDRTNASFLFDFHVHIYDFGAPNLGREFASQIFNPIPD